MTPGAEPVMPQDAVSTVHSHKSTKSRKQSLRVDFVFSVQDVAVMAGC